MANTTSSGPSSNSLRFGFEDGENLLDELNSGDGVAPALMQDMYDEMSIARRDPEGVLLVGTEGTKAITIILAPQSVVEGIGPVLVPTFDSQRVVAMVSREFIEANAVDCNSEEDQELAQQNWDELLDKLFIATVDIALHTTI
ncbi:hypothetical protein HQ459_01260 [bacterium]|nr:hypothetical protein [bacterium]